MSGDSSSPPKRVTGQKTSANSAPVVIASDQSAVPVSATALPLPSGAATSGNQTTQITSLQILDDVPSAQNAAFSKGTPVMGQLDDSATTAATEDNVAAVRITAQRAMHTNLRSNGGAEIGTATNPLKVSQVVPPGGQDVFGATVVAGRQNQINTPFSSGTLSQLITLTTAGTGSGSIVNNQAQFATGTGTTSASKGVSLNSTSYTSGSEVYAEFSAAFTTPTSVNSFQKIGLYDSSDGFYVGYTGTTFGVTVRSGAVDTTTAKSSWNVDTLTGTSDSSFTRNGLPEAINLTFANVFRIRFGWLGSATIYFEVLSPDGVWVTFHKILQPNTSNTTSIGNPNLPITVNVSKISADATNLVIYTACWGAGTTGTNQTTVVSALPAASFSPLTTINSGLTVYSSYTASQKIAIKQFYAGGTGIGKQALYAYNASATSLITSGDFESAGDVTVWPYFSFGGSGTGSVAQSSAQANTGTKSAAVTFATSDSNHSNGIKQTYSSPQDYSGYRYIQAYFFNTLSVGATYTRTISIVLTDSTGNIRTYTVSGSSATAPFSTSNWIQILGELQNPSSSTGSPFDLTQIASIELRMFDSANRAGTVYWDSIQLVSTLTPIFPIYHPANTSFNVDLDPVYVLNAGSTIIVSQTNNDSTRKEYYALVGGVSL